MDARIFLKMLNDIDVKIMLCKSNFQWKLLAEKYEEAVQRIEGFYGQTIPSDIAGTMARVRAQLVEKKGQLPPEDLLV